MNFCRSCDDLRRTRNGYFGSEDKRVDDAKECHAHPTMDNWKVFRTLKTLKVWSIEQPGFRHKMFTGVVLVPDAGHVSRRTAEAILFDYEAPFIDLLLHERLIRQHPGTPTTLTITKKGDDYIRARLAEQAVKEAK